MTRLLVFGFGIVMTLAGVSLLAAQQPAGLWLLITGLIFIVAAILERVRYRSNEAEATAERPGPGGGEPAGTTLDSRFRPTEERFEDPTTGVRMRVWVDPVAGERRYVPED
ncbi:MAG TPA: hypothetical protein VFN41_13265 [Candidatus Limnocylindrales bacterium]|nr:hypothetical protein [Candidatus Limnocylindrales bacterium]